MELYFCKDKTKITLTILISGCSLVRLKCASGGREIGGSNPLTPTLFSQTKVQNPPAPLIIDLLVVFYLPNFNILNAP